MLPGPNKIIECTNCNHLINIPSLLSGNTFNAVHWSDGKIDAPMYFEPLEVTRCHECKTIFWIKDSKVVGKYDWRAEENNNELFEPPLLTEDEIEVLKQLKKEEYVKTSGQENFDDQLKFFDWMLGGEKVPDEWKEAPVAVKIDATGYVESLDHGLGKSKSREKILRTKLWWILNDPIRRGEQLDIQPEQRDLFYENLELLAELLRDSDPAGQVMRAEIAREMGEFEKCIALLTVIPNEFHSVNEQIRQLAKKGIHIVHKLQKK